LKQTTWPHDPSVQRRVDKVLAAVAVVLILMGTIIVISALEDWGCVHSFDFGDVTATTADFGDHTPTPTARSCSRRGRTARIDDGGRSVTSRRIGRPPPSRPWS
jgi:hypothetical protein